MFLKLYFSPKSSLLKKLIIEKAHAMKVCMEKSLNVHNTMFDHGSASEVVK